MHRTRLLCGLAALSLLGASAPARDVPAEPDSKTFPGPAYVTASVATEAPSRREPAKPQPAMQLDPAPAPSPPSLAERLAAAAPSLDRRALDRALFAVARAEKEGRSARRPYLTVIDFSLPSDQRRLWLFDLQKGTLLRNELVAHGKNTGGRMATRFSNVEGSKQSSLGLFLTGKTYYGGNGYSLRLHGLEQGLNHRALERLIVMHGAWYVSDAHVRRHGRLGRSWGCPALDQKIARQVIDTVKEGSWLYAFSDRGMESSTLLAGFAAPDAAASETT